MPKQCHTLQGKSLSRVVLGNEIHANIIEHDVNHRGNQKRMVIKKRSAGSTGSTVDGSTLWVAPKYKLSDRRLRGDLIQFDNETHTSGASALEKMSRNQGNSQSYASMLYDDWNQIHYITHNLHPLFALRERELKNNTFAHNTIIHADNTPISTDDADFKNKLRMDFYTALNPHITDVNDNTHRQLSNKKGHKSSDNDKNSEEYKKMPVLEHAFALSQSWRCAPLNLVKQAIEWSKDGQNNLHILLLHFSFICFSKKKKCFLVISFHTFFNLFLLYYLSI
jgi:hypothetical protein